MTAPSRIVADALRVLAELCAAGEPLSVRVDHGGMTASLDVRAASGSAGAGDAAPETTATEDDILGLLGTVEKPLKVTDIARRLHRKAHTRFRTTISGLAARGVLLRVEGFRYWLAARGAPPTVRE